MPLRGWGSAGGNRKRVAQLERKIGQQTMEVAFLKGCLQRIQEQRMLQALTGKGRSTGKFRNKQKQVAR